MYIYCEDSLIVSMSYRKLLNIKFIMKYMSESKHASLRYIIVTAHI